MSKTRYTVLQGWLQVIAATALLSLTGCANSVVDDAGAPGARGKFGGDLIVKVLDDGRRMQLAAPFEYIDSKNRRWVVPAGETVDGASIPESLWSMVGGPFSGRYRKASVIHDFFCDYRVRPSDQVHNVFFDAMRASGVGLQKAKMMFFAVLRFGPSWSDISRKDLCKGKHKPETLGLTSSEAKSCELKTRGGLSGAPAYTPRYNKKDFDEAKKAIAAGNLSLHEIRALATAQRR